MGWENRMLPRMLESCSSANIHQAQKIFPKKRKRRTRAYAFSALWKITRIPSFFHSLPRMHVHVRECEQKNNGKQKNFFLPAPAAPFAGTRELLISSPRVSARRVPLVIFLPAAERSRASAWRGRQKTCLIYRAFLRTAFAFGGCCAKGCMRRECEWDGYLRGKYCAKSSYCDAFLAQASLSLPLSLSLSLALSLSLSLSLLCYCVCQKVFSLSRACIRAKVSAFVYRYYRGENGPACESMRARIWEGYDFSEANEEGRVNLKKALFVTKEG